MPKEKKSKPYRQEFNTVASDFQPDPKKIPSTITMEERNLEIEKINEAILETLSVTDEKKYIRALTYKMAPIWWRAVAADLLSEDKDLHRLAIMEIGKLQVKLAPNEITADPDSGIVFQVLTYKKETPPETFNGEIVTEGEITK